MAASNDEFGGVLRGRQDKSNVGRAHGPPHTPPSERKFPATTGLSARMPATRGSREGSTVRGAERVVSAPYLGKGAAGGGVDATVHTIAVTSGVRILAFSPTTIVYCLVVEAASTLNAPPVRVDTLTPSPVEEHPTVRTSPTAGRLGRVKVKAALSIGYEATANE